MNIFKRSIFWKEKMKCFKPAATFSFSSTSASDTTCYGPTENDLPFISTQELHEIPEDVVGAEDLMALMAVTRKTCRLKCDTV
jgi:hypothetical protein